MPVFCSYEYNSFSSVQCVGFQTIFFISFLIATHYWIFLKSNSPINKRKCVNKLCFMNGFRNLTKFQQFWKRHKINHIIKSLLNEKWKRKKEITNVFLLTNWIYCTYCTCISCKKNCYLFRYMIKPTLYHQGDQNLVYTVQKTTLDHKEHICLWTPKTRLFQTVLRQKKIAVLVHIFFLILFITMLTALLLLNKMVYFFKGQVLYKVYAE